MAHPDRRWIATRTLENPGRIPFGIRAAPSIRPGTPPGARRRGINQLGHGRRREAGAEVGRQRGDQAAEPGPDLVAHELTHVWQDQDHRLRMWTSYLHQGYANNPHELEARAAVNRTR